MALRSESIIMSQTVIVNFEMINRIEFTFTIRVHHVCKTTWFSVINEKLDCKDDDPGSALSCGKYVKRMGTLVGRTAIELSNLIDYFLKDEKKLLLSGQENAKLDLLPL